MSIEIRIRWLKLAAAITAATGAVIAVAAIPALAAPTEMLVAIVVPGADSTQSLGTPTARLFAAVSGGVLVGWGVLLWMIADSVLGTNPRLASRLVVASIVSWFAVDSAMSIAAGAWPNVILNGGFLALFLPPVLGVSGSAVQAESR